MRRTDAEDDDLDWQFERADALLDTMMGALAFMSLVMAVGLLASAAMPSLLPMVVSVGVILVLMFLSFAVIGGLKFIIRCLHQRSENSKKELN